jgi:peptidyl-tRNA hydrolase
MNRYEEELEDKKGAIKIRKSTKNRQHNGFHKAITITF